MADLGLQAADLGVGFVELALGGVDRVAGGIVRLAARFQLGLAGAQAGDGGFQLVLRLQHFLGLAGALFARAGFRNHSECCFFAVGLQLAVARGDFGLRLQLFELAVQLAQDILDQVRFSRVSDRRFSVSRRRSL